jgi:hypothetical protein
MEVVRSYETCVNFYQATRRQAIVYFSSYKYGSWYSVGQVEQEKEQKKKKKWGGGGSRRREERKAEKNDPVSSLTPSFAETCFNIILTTTLSSPELSSDIPKTASLLMV